MKKKIYKIKKLSRINKEINIPADKSISHRALIISGLTKAKTTIFPFIASEDLTATLNCLKSCGIKATLDKDRLTLKGAGLHFKKRRKVKLYAHQSGTTLRVFTGLLCGQRFSSYFDAHPSLKKRPMLRITAPLRQMGAKIRAKKYKEQEFAPFLIEPAQKLSSINYKLPVASAQVKSAIILASLYAKDKTQIHEPVLSRDHTERMLREFGVNIKRSRGKIIIEPPDQLKGPAELFIPSDFSSAAFFIVLTLVAQDSQIILKNINLNPSRCGLLKVLKRMGANIRIKNKKDSFEPYGDIIVKSSKLKAVKVEAKEIPSMIDEIPILSIAAALARGETLIKGVRELRVKETDRIDSIIYNLKGSGVNVSLKSYLKDGKQNWDLKIQGTKKFKKKINFKSFSDHRTAMSAIVLGSVIDGEHTLDDINCINKSFPQFLDKIETLRGE